MDRIFFDKQIVQALQEKSLVNNGADKFVVAYAVVGRRDSKRIYFNIEKSKKSLFMEGKMNIDTGKLERLYENQKLEANFVQVPRELEQEALRELDGKQSTIVDLTTNSPLANFARSQRKKRQKTRQKMAKASKRRNR